MISKAISAVMLVGAFTVSGHADSLSPSGEVYTSPTHVPGFSWVMGVSPENLAEVTIPRDGYEVWPAADPAVCQTACDAFMGCQAFIFEEPLTLEDAPSCRLLKETPDLIVRYGTNLYIRNQ